MNNSNLTAWQTSEEDVEAACLVNNDIAQGILFNLDNDSITKAALSGSDMDEQINYAYDEIRKQFKSMKKEILNDEAVRIAKELRDECDGSYVGSETTETIDVYGEKCDLFVVAFWEKSFWHEWNTVLNGEELTHSS